MCKKYIRISTCIMYEYAMHMIMCLCRVHHIYITTMMMDMRGWPMMSARRTCGLGSTVRSIPKMEPLQLCLVLHKNTNK